MDLSVVIPSYKDPSLHKTVQSILDNFATQFEIIVVIDGYPLATPVVEDDRVRVIYHDQNRGMRESINTAVAASTGRFLLRTDEHCMFCPSFDQLILDRAHYDEIITARRYALDPNKWERMDDEPYDYERLIVQDTGTGARKFSSQRWRSRTKERRHIMVDETMAMQGSMWVMSRHWWDTVIERLDSEGYGPLYQDSTEMIFKTWLAGGRLMLNKYAWYAHRHRSFGRAHHYPRSRAEREWAFALEKWYPEYLVQKQRWGM